jgi:hypothetical protein
MLEMAAESNLIRLGLPARTPTMVRPGIVGHLLSRASVSVLAIPPNS